MKKLTPGCVAAHLERRNAVLKQLVKQDELLIKALLDPLSPRLRLLFDFDPRILRDLVESGYWIGSYKEKSSYLEPVCRRLSVLRSRLRTLRTVWAGLVNISIRLDATRTHVRFTVIEAPKS